MNEHTPEHTILVAFTVEAFDRTQAQGLLYGALPEITATSPVTSWWVAEDDRTDGSDNDSAVFVPYGTKAKGEELVRPLHEEDGVVTAAYEFESDEKYTVVQVDAASPGRIRVYINDGCIYDGNPEVDDLLVAMDRALD